MGTAICTIMWLGKGKRGQERGRREKEIKFRVRKVFNKKTKSPLISLSLWLGLCEQIRVLSLCSDLGVHFGWHDGGSDCRLWILCPLEQEILASSFLKSLLS